MHQSTEWEVLNSIYLSPTLNTWIEFAICSALVNLSSVLESEWMKRSSTSSRGYVEEGLRSINTSDWPMICSMLLMYSQHIEEQVCSTNKANNEKSQRKCHHIQQSDNKQLEHFNIQMFLSVWWLRSRKWLRRRLWLTMSLFTPLGGRRQLKIDELLQTGRTLIIYELFVENLSIEQESNIASLLIINMLRWISVVNECTNRIHNIDQRWGSWIYLTNSSKVALHTL